MGWFGTAVRCFLPVGILALILFSLFLSCDSDQSDGRYPTPPNTGSPETDREVLISLYHATDGDSWFSNDNWLSDKLLSRWAGVTTEHGRVIRLELSFNQLNGEIPSEMGDLVHLQELRLDGFNLKGEIPRELGNLANLRVLDLSFNRLTGEIPSELGNLSTLETLSLGSNQL